MKILSTEGLTKLIQLIKNSFISVNDTVTTDTITLANVATTGDYNDLINTPNIPVYTAGEGIDITNNVISNTQTSAEWGNITGTLSDQTDLQDALDDKYDASNPSGFITGITSSDVTTALGYTPYNSTNPNGYITISALNGYATETWVTNQGYITGITSSDVTTALGYTPYNATNPNGYITASALTGYATETYVDTGLATKQATLVSGTNIKTINNISLLGSGDITITSAPDIDNKSITTNSDDELQTVGVIDQNSTSNAIKTWTGTKAQYDAIVTKDSNTLYNITDDSDVTFQLLELLYPVGSLYIATSNVSVCPLSVLGVGTWQLKANSTLVTDVNTTAPVVGNGMTLGLNEGTDNCGLVCNGDGAYWRTSVATSVYGISKGSNYSGELHTGKSLGVTTDPTKSGMEANITSTTLSVTIWERIS